MDSYNYTGANVPIDVNITIMYVIKQLKEYDEKLAQGILLSQSPYHDKIIMKMDNEKIIEIPYDIQQEAIKKWEIIKTQSDYEKEKKSLEENIESLSNQLNSDLIENFEDDNDWDSSYIVKIILVLLIVGIGIYFYYKKYYF